MASRIYQSFDGVKTGTKEEVDRYEKVRGIETALENVLDGKINIIDDDGLINNIATGICDGKKDLIEPLRHAWGGFVERKKKDKPAEAVSDDPTAQPQQQ